MGLAIDGNLVHGIARGGQAFVSIGNVNSTDGSLSIDGQDYLSKNKMKIKDTGEFNIQSSSDDSGGITISPVDVTNNLSNCGGYLAICVISKANYSGVFNEMSHPIIIPTATSTENLSFDDDSLSGSLSRTTDNRLTFTVSPSDTSDAVNAHGDFYILSNN